MVFIENKLSELPKVRFRRIEHSLQAHNSVL